MKYFRIFAKNLAIDLGTANVLVHVEKKGIVLNEPAVVAIDNNSGELIAFGHEAFNMIGKTPENISVVKPLENGVVSDFDITKILLEHCIKNAMPGFSLIQPNVIITAPAGVSDVELRAIEDACIYSGIRGVYIVEGALAAAIGSGMDIDKPTGHMIVDMGAGNIEIAILSLNGIVASNTINFGGDYLNQKIIDYIYEKYAVNIGFQTAENLKIKIGAVDTSNENKSIDASGRDIITGMPKTVRVYASDVNEAIFNELTYIIDKIQYILEKNPPELSSDIIRNGIYLTGGSSLIDGLADFIEQSLDIKVIKSENPFEDTVIGAGKMIERLEQYKTNRK
ncbi:MAG: rod shape-determining protein [Tissierellia bacterium]|nr:rod shape-determining protein [Tissierellia bacterium]